MNNKIKNKILASLMLTVFSVSNTLLTTAVAMEDVSVVRYGTEQKPNLRPNNAETSLQLRGDVSFTG